MGWGTHGPTGGTAASLGTGCQVGHVELDAEACGPNAVPLVWVTQHGAGVHCMHGTPGDSRPWSGMLLRHVYPGCSTPTPRPSGCWATPCARVVRIRSVRFLAPARPIRQGREDAGEEVYATARGMRCGMHVTAGGTAGGWGIATMPRHVRPCTAPRYDRRTGRSCCFRPPAPPPGSGVRMSEKKMMPSGRKARRGCMESSMAMSGVSERMRKGYLSEYLRAEVEESSWQ